MQDEALYRRLLALATIPLADGCWVWNGSVTGGGYGSLYIKGKRRLAHRAMWTAINGEIPAGQIVLHRCDNRKCCRPDHLQAGSLADNNYDRDAKGRSVAWGRKQRLRAHLTAKLDSAELWAENCSPESHDLPGPVESRPI